MAEERTGAIRDQSMPAPEETGARQWRRTLCAMVGIQFIMTMAFSVLSPIMPLLLPELGVETRAGSPCGQEFSTASLLLWRRSHRPFGDGSPIAMAAS